MTTRSSILVADDEPGIRELLTWELGAQGHCVETASDGADALERIRKQDFDVLISDVRMPKLDGVEVLRAVRKLAPDTEVVIATGFAEVEYAIECVRHGAFDFVQKPFHVAELLAIVARAIERRRLRRTAGLYEASRVILDGQEAHRLVESIIRLAMQAMDADDACLMLPGSDGRLYVAHSHTLSADVRADTRVKLGERIAGRVAEVGTPLVIPSGLGADPRFADLTSDGRVRSSIVYPLAVGARLVGVLGINRLAPAARPFRDVDIERASILAAQILLALENARLVTQVAASERLASLGLLAAGVAHEINNPNACILLNHSFLAESLSRFGSVATILETEARSESLPAVWEAWKTFGSAAAFSEMRDALAGIGEGAARIRDIVHDMRAVSRPQSHEPTVFDVNSAIRSALRISCAEVRGTANVRIALDADLLVRGRPDRIVQVLVNLLVNAAQAIAGAADGRPHEISIRSSREGTGIVIRVADDGPGIRRDHLARVFEMFFTTKDATTGTGLGLAISREIAMSHGGDLTVESTAGHGATFILTLPSAAGSGEP